MGMEQNPIPMNTETPHKAALCRAGGGGVV